MSLPGSTVQRARAYSSVSDFLKAAPLVEKLFVGFIVLGIVFVIFGVIFGSRGLEIGEELEEKVSKYLFIENFFTDDYQSLELYRSVDGANQAGYQLFYGGYAFGAVALVCSFLGGFAILKRSVRVMYMYILLCPVAAVMLFLIGGAGIIFQGGERATAKGCILDACARAGEAVAATCEDDVNDYYATSSQVLLGAAVPFFLAGPSLIVSVVLGVLSRKGWPSRKSQQATLNLHETAPNGDIDPHTDHALKEVTGVTVSVSVLDTHGSVGHVVGKELSQAVATELGKPPAESLSLALSRGAEGVGVSDAQLQNPDLTTQRVSISDSGVGLTADAVMLPQSVEATAETKGAAAPSGTARAAVSMLNSLSTNETNENTDTTAFDLARTVPDLQDLVSANSSASRLQSVRERKQLDFQHVSLAMDMKRKADLAQASGDVSSATQYRDAAEQFLQSATKTEVASDIGFEAAAQITSSIPSIDGQYPRVSSTRVSSTTSVKSTAFTPAPVPSTALTPAPASGGSGDSGGPVSSSPFLSQDISSRMEGGVGGGVVVGGGGDSVSAAELAQLKGLLSSNGAVGDKSTVTNGRGDVTSSYKDENNNKV